MEQVKETALLSRREEGVQKNIFAFCRQLISEHFNNKSYFHPLVTNVVESVSATAG